MLENTKPGSIASGKPLDEAAPSNKLCLAEANRIKEYFMSVPALCLSRIAKLQHF